MRKLAQNLSVMAVLAFAAMGSVSAEEFKYYVWIDDEGIVHAEEEAPKGRDYQVRIIEDINANVVPTEDFRPYGDVPLNHGGETTTRTVSPAAGEQSADETAPQATTSDNGATGQQ